MTYEEAKTKILEWACWYNNDFGCYHYERNICNDCEVRFALYAIEKQIPKKPIERIDGWLYWDCPLCGAEVGENMNYKDHHCKCGQAIDWSEEE